jgi:hypothetical protein
MLLIEQKVTNTNHISTRSINFQYQLRELQDYNIHIYKC